MIKGSYHSREAKEKMCANHADISGERHPLFSKHLSEAYRRKISETLSIVRIGMHHSEETKQKISKAQSGENHHFYGKHFSEESKRKMSEAHIRVPFSDKHRQALSGANNGRWQGGIARLPYSFEWLETLKATIRERDAFECQICKAEEKDFNRKLPVHHIDYDKQNCEDWNLITLCLSCHTKTNSNRDCWEAFLQGLMEEKRKSVYAFSCL